MGFISNITPFNHTIMRVTLTVLAILGALTIINVVISFITNFSVKIVFFNPTIMRITLITAFILGALAVFSLSISITAGFNRVTDLRGIIAFIVYSIPIAILSLKSLLWVIIKFNPYKRFHYLTYVVMTLTLFISSPLFIFDINPYGWLIERVLMTGTNVTEDGLYQYRLENVNRFQRNESSRIILISTKTGEEIVIYLPISEEVLVRISNTRDGINETDTIITLNSTGTRDKYIALIYVGINQSRMNQFLINVEERTAVLLK